MTERQILLNTILVGRVNAHAAAQAAPALRALGVHEVASPGALAQDLAAGRNLEPLGGRFFRFDAFWTSHKVLGFRSKKSAQYRWRVGRRQAVFSPLAYVKRLL